MMNKLRVPIKNPDHLEKETESLLDTIQRTAQIFKRIKGNNYLK